MSIESNKYLLPTIQREFVWKSWQIENVYKCNCLGNLQLVEGYENIKKNDMEFMEKREKLLLENLKMILNNYS